MKTQENEFYFAIYDKEDIYNDDECLINFDTEEDARDFVDSENAGYGYDKLFYRQIEKIKL